MFYICSRQALLRRDSSFAGIFEQARAVVFGFFLVRGLGFLAVVEAGPDVLPIALGRAL